MANKTETIQKMKDDNFENNHKNVHRDFDRRFSHITDISSTGRRNLKYGNTYDVLS